VGEPKNSYHVNYAESWNGIEWKQTGTTVVDFKDNKEYAIARPTVFKEDGMYKMLYSYRRENDRYRIGYGESEDGIKWVRKDDEAGIDVSPSGWDSEMVCYGCRLEHKGKEYLIYNGNSYGKEGAGIAKRVG
jgi:hypothetical protein